VNSQRRGPLPLWQEHVTAAYCIYSEMSEWRTACKAFRVLHEKVPGFDMEAALLKVVAVNQLYGTNVYAVVRMAKHVADIAEIITNAAEDPAEVIRRIAALPPGPGQRPRNHWAFASKFAHFFIAPEMERFPIYDSYALSTLRYHLGRHPIAPEDGNIYRAFLRDLRELREASPEVRYSATELDRYLWLSGLYAEYGRRGEEAAINADAKRLFRDRPAWISDALDVISRRRQRPQPDVCLASAVELGGGSQPPALRFANCATSWDS